MPPTPTAPAPQQTPPPAAVDLVGQALERNSDGPGFADWFDYDEVGLIREFQAEFGGPWGSMGILMNCFTYGSPITQAQLERRMTPRLNAAVARRDEWVCRWARAWLDSHSEE